MINCLHHFEILTKHSERVLNYFIRGFDFKLVCVRQTPSLVAPSRRPLVYQQHLLNCNSINLLVTSLKEQERDKSVAVSEQHEGLFRTSLSAVEAASPRLLDQIIGKHDSAFNVAFQVCDLDRILDNCERYGVPVLKRKHRLVDRERAGRDGQVDCAIIKSCVDGVLHTLLDVKDYRGRFLPGFEDEAAASAALRRSRTAAAAFSSPTHYDHLTYATHRNTSNELIDWYAKIFNMKRFRVEKEENDGLVVRTGTSGMNLKVINYWLCAETGVQFAEQKPSQAESTSTLKSANDFKFVISEPLEETTTSTTSDGSKTKKKSTNQISIFLDENGGPGVQHIGLYSSDVVQLVESSKKSDANIKYFETPEAYYNSPEKVEEIERCGLSRDDLKKNHVLLDAEFDSNQRQQTTTTTTTTSSSTSQRYRKYLLQVFTQPLFERNTLFLELIQRVGDANGFGAANIRALWNAVQLQMSSSSSSSSNAVEPEPVQNLIKNKS